MARTVPPPTARTKPTRASLPLGDLLLADGRTLALLGRETLRQPGAMPCHVGTWRSGDGLAVIASEDNTPHGKLLHVSMSYPDRLPSWEEIKAVRAAFYPPHVDVAMILPAEADYVNVHQYCMHLWQLPKPWGIR